MNTYDSEPKIIGISGKLRSGKDTFTEFLHRYSKHVLHAITPAHALKKCTAILTGSNIWDQYDQTFKSTPIPELAGIRPREIQQGLGEWARNFIHPDVWLYIMSRSIEKGRHYVVPSIRYRNEVEFILERGGTVIRIERGSDLRYPELYKSFLESGYEEWDQYIIKKHPKLWEEMNHPSETELDDYEFSTTIYNNAGLDELAGHAKAVANILSLT